jgi:phosphatidate cytidylyltransferase
MEDSQPFDADVDFDHQRRRRPEPPPPLGPQQRRRRGPSGDGEGPRRSRSETLARIAWAIPWIAVVVTIAVVGGEVFAAAMLVFACIGLTELYRMAIRARGFLLVSFVAAAGLTVAAFYGDHYEMMVALTVSIPLIFVAAIMRPDRRGITMSVAVTVFGIVWIAIPFAHAVLLRELPEHGAGLLVDVLVATFVADTAAYAGGRMFGRHRLAPELSPNKTLEGLAFGFVGGTMGFWFAGLYQDWLPGIDALAPLGDLFESMIKRDLDIKDSGTVFGPHGGLLDRLDAVLFTIVAGYYLAVLFVY